MGASGKVFGFVMLMALASSCSSGSAKVIDAGVTTDVAQTGDDGPPNDVGQTHDARPKASVDAALMPPAGVMFPEAPDVACGNDATDCPLPPSACADPSCDGGSCPGLSWVIYYDGPTCVNNKCAYNNKYFECAVGSQCSAGGCRFNATLAASQ